MSNGHYSVNRGVEALIDRMRQDASQLRIGLGEGAEGEKLVDAGASVLGSIEAGRRLAEICLGGLADVTLDAASSVSKFPFGVTVRTSSPVLACLASQYAGWQLTSDAGAKPYFSMGSGPARALARRETLFEDLGYRDESDTAALVLETASPPPADLVRRICQDCGVEPVNLTILYAPTQSLAGMVQIVARVVEVALHKAHELGFELANIVEGIGTAPLPPPHPDFITAMGRTNDAVIYGGRVCLHVTGPASEAERLAQNLPSSQCKDYGRPFAEIFRQYKGDFYQIDPSLFSPSQVAVVALETGEIFHSGAINDSLIDASFG
ncbi:methenyltetrahydromethanopterin cyclohydrolase [Aureimonas fodinaquatilis]|uniref:Methenyltetrahydromethanopterin cyclohydrolase n=1 Tax=Aureimonas fodinaquatilis TaxID=2565783 RepID=A0A5B0DP46_9HYPH|nr:methenyltetrahydromethanopterin cyclohydrolase [Aureimonas fodinaquatilis]KAA0968617.1 methenyltetrahydromethanopterin cyclohydrolase [Aureimonas fodinaquatilis]